MNDKKEKLIKQYEELKNLKKLKEDEISELYKDIREKQKIIEEIQKEENSNIKNQSGINSEIKKMFQALEKGDGYNSKLICNHFGVNSESGIFRISMSKWGKNTQLVIEIKEKWIVDLEVGMSKKAWACLRQNIMDDFELIRVWHGEEDNLSITLILDKECPESLFIVLENYQKECDTKSGFPQDNFEGIFLKNLKMVKGEK